MGVEMGVELVPVLQKYIIEKSHFPDTNESSSSFSNLRYIPTCVCTHMLDSMQHSLSPTRAEVSDVCNAVITGIIFYFSLLFYFIFLVK
jgi:pyruvate kinase